MGTSWCVRVCCGAVIAAPVVVCRGWWLSRLRREPCTARGRGATMGRWSERDDLGRIVIDGLAEKVVSRAKPRDQARLFGERPSGGSTRTATVIRSRS